MIVAAMVGLAIQYAMQMAFRFRATHDDIGAVINIVIYTPCFSLISMALFNVFAPENPLRFILSIC